MTRSTGLTPADLTNTTVPADKGGSPSGTGGAAAGSATRGDFTGHGDVLAGRRPFTRDQRMTILYGILCVVLVIVILQLWLLTATMNAYLGGDQSVIWPAAGASVVCLGLNVGLLRYLYHMERA